MADGGFTATLRPTWEMRLDRKDTWMETKAIRQLLEAPQDPTTAHVAQRGQPPDRERHLGQIPGAEATRTRTNDPPGASRWKRCQIGARIQDLHLFGPFASRLRFIAQRMPKISEPRHI